MSSVPPIVELNAPIEPPELAAVRSTAKNYAVAQSQNKELLRRIAQEKRAPQARARKTASLPRMPNAFECVLFLGDLSPCNDVFVGEVFSLLDLLRQIGRYQQSRAGKDDRQDEIDRQIATKQLEKAMESLRQSGFARLKRRAALEAAIQGQLDELNMVFGEDAKAQISLGLNVVLGAVRPAEGTAWRAVLNAVSGPAPEDAVFHKPPAREIKKKTLTPIREAGPSHEQSPPPIASDDKTIASGFNATAQIAIASKSYAKTTDMHKPEEIDLESASMVDSFYLPPYAPSKPSEPIEETKNTAGDVKEIVFSKEEYPPTMESTTPSNLGRSDRFRGLSLERSASSQSQQQAFSSEQARLAFPPPFNDADNPLIRLQYIESLLKCQIATANADLAESARLAIAEQRELFLKSLETKTPFARRQYVDLLLESEELHRQLANLDGAIASRSKALADADANLLDLAKIIDVFQKGLQKVPPALREELKSTMAGREINAAEGLNTILEQLKILKQTFELLRFYIANGPKVIERLRAALPRKSGPDKEKAIRDLEQIEDLVNGTRKDIDMASIAMAAMADLNDLLHHDAARRTEALKVDCLSAYTSLESAIGQTNDLLRIAVNAMQDEGIPKDAPKDMNAEAVSAALDGIATSLRMRQKIAASLGFRAPAGDAGLESVFLDLAGKIHAFQNRGITDPWRAVLQKTEEIRRLVAGDAALTDAAKGVRKRLLRVVIPNRRRRANAGQVRLDMIEIANDRKMWVKLDHRNLLRQQRVEFARRNAALERERNRWRRVVTALAAAEKVVGRNPNANISKSQRTRIAQGVQARIAEIDSQIETLRQEAAALKNKTQEVENTYREFLVERGNSPAGRYLRFVDSQAEQATRLRMESPPELETAPAEQPDPLEVLQNAAEISPCKALRDAIEADRAEIARTRAQIDSRREAVQNAERDVEIALSLGQGWPYNPKSWTPARQYRRLLRMWTDLEDRLKSHGNFARLWFNPLKQTRKQAYAEGIRDMKRAAALFEDFLLRCPDVQREAYRQLSWVTNDKHSLYCTGLADDLPENDLIILKLNCDSLCDMMQLMAKSADAAVHMRPEDAWARGWIVKRENMRSYSAPKKEMQRQHPDSLENTPPLTMPQAPILLDALDQSRRDFAARNAPPLESPPVPDGVRSEFLKPDILFTLVDNVNSLDLLFGKLKTLAGQPNHAEADAIEHKDFMMRFTDAMEIIDKAREKLPSAILHPLRSLLDASRDAVDHWHKGDNLSQFIEKRQRCHEAFRYAVAAETSLPTDAWKRWHDADMLKPTADAESAKDPAQMLLRAAMDVHWDAINHHVDADYWMRMSIGARISPDKHTMLQDMSHMSNYSTVKWRSELQKRLQDHLANNYDNASLAELWRLLGALHKARTTYQIHCAEMARHDAVVHYEVYYISSWNAQANQDIPGNAQRRDFMEAALPRLRRQIDRLAAAFSAKFEQCFGEKHASAGPDPAIEAIRQKLDKRVMYIENITPDDLLHMTNMLLIDANNLNEFDRVNKIIMAQDQLYQKRLKMKALSSNKLVNSMKIIECNMDCLELETECAAMTALLGMADLPADSAPPSPMPLDQPRPHRFEPPPAPNPKETIAVYFLRRERAELENIERMSQNTAKAFARLSQKQFQGFGEALNQYKQALKNPIDARSFLDKQDANLKICLRGEMEIDERCKLLSKKYHDDATLQPYVQALSETMRQLHVKRMKQAAAALDSKASTFIKNEIAKEIETLNADLEKLKSPDPKDWLELFEPADSALNAHVDQAPKEQLLAAINVMQVSRNDALKSVDAIADAVQAFRRLDPQSRAAALMQFQGSGQPSGILSNAVEEFLARLKGDVKRIESFLAPATKNVEGKYHRQFRRKLVQVLTDLELLLLEYDAWTQLVPEGCRRIAELEYAISAKLADYAQLLRLGGEDPNEQWLPRSLLSCVGPFYAPSNVAPGSDSSLGMPPHEKKTAPCLFESQMNLLNAYEREYAELATAQQRALVNQKVNALRMPSQVIVNAPRVHAHRKPVMPPDPLETNGVVFRNMITEIRKKLPPGEESSKIRQRVELLLLAFQWRREVQTKKATAEAWLEQYKTHGNAIDAISGKKHISVQDECLQCDRQLSVATNLNDLLFRYATSDSAAHLANADLQLLGKFVLNAADFHAEILRELADLHSKLKQSKMLLAMLVNAPKENQVSLASQLDETKKSMETFNHQIASMAEKQDVSDRLLGMAIQMMSEEAKTRSDDAAKRCAQFAENAKLHCDGLKAHYQKALEIQDMDVAKATQEDKTRVTEQFEQDAKKLQTGFQQLEKFWAADGAPPPPQKIERQPRESSRKKYLRSIMPSNEPQKEESK